MIGGKDRAVLPTIVFAQFAGTSLWFAPNAVVSQIDNFGEAELAWLTSLVQVGFILGTLTLTYFAATDRFSAPLIFTAMAIMGAILNALCIATTDFAAWAVLRTAVGFCLAGVYPVGMKIAANEYPSGLGARLGVLVGALTLGTAFPWLIRGLGDGTSSLPFSTTLIVVSGLAVAGALLMALVIAPRQGGGSMCGCVRSIRAPIATRRKTNELEKEEVKNEDSSTTTVDNTNENESNTATQNETLESSTDPPKMGMAAMRVIASDSRFRASAIGYFGHQWELYAFWAYVPKLIESHELISGGLVLGNAALTSFATIGIGAISCALVGLWSLSAGKGVHPGSAVAANTCLIVSLVCCLLAPAYMYMSSEVFLLFLLVWGSAVVADSGQFSSLSAKFAHPGLVGTALTLTTSIGFLITVISIQMEGALINAGWDPGNALALLAIGPALGVTRSYYEWPLHQLLPCWMKPKSNMESDLKKNKDTQIVSSRQGAVVDENVLPSGAEGSVSNHMDDRVIDKV